MDTVSALSECGKCGRRFVPSRPRCIKCGVRTFASTVAARGEVLACTTVRRSRPGSLFSAPYRVAWIREIRDGEAAAFFTCPVAEGSDEPVVESVVALEVRTWMLPAMGEFQGVVARVAHV